MGRRLVLPSVSCVTRCAALMFMLAVATLAGCANEAYMEFPDTVENSEYDEVETQEPEDSNDSANTNLIKIYESFLNGEISVEQNGQQVIINELFWDNDIEYCLFDIDGDDREELHIRDSAVYYAVKVSDETPRIIFEGWWCYEPVVTDKRCGILRYFHGYGYEEMEFIKIGADGSRESDGLSYWSDKNDNGNIDLEWTGRRLKDFATWQEAYIDFIKKIHVTVPTLDGFEYSLIYVDADDIPELYIFTGGMATGEIIVSYYNGKIGAMNRDRIGIAYMEHGGLLYNRNGAMGFYPCNIYRLERGEFSEIGTGWYLEYDDGQGNVRDDYYWEGSAVTETEYEAHIDKLIDTSKCVEPSLLYSEDEMLEILVNKK